MCKKNIDKIQGRVLLQTSPSLAYNTQATIDHARVYDAEFARVGITRDRYCIKIPATGEALNAAKVLTAEGIPTLGTAVFCLPQAIACSDAGMLYISPYYNGRCYCSYTYTTVLSKCRTTVGERAGQTHAS
jgi:transaldolase